MSKFVLSLLAIATTIAMPVFSQTEPQSQSNMPVLALAKLSCDDKTPECCSKWLDTIQTSIEQNPVQSRPPVTIGRLKAWKTEGLSVCRQKQEIERRARQLDSAATQSNTPTGNPS